MTRWLASVAPKLIINPSTKLSAASDKVTKADAMSRQWTKGLWASPLLSICIEPVVNAVATKSLMTRSSRKLAE